MKNSKFESDTAKKTYNWDIEKGDYKLNPESRRTFQKRKQRAKIIRNIFWAILYILVLVLASVWFFSK